MFLPVGSGKTRMMRMMQQCVGYVSGVGSVLFTDLAQHLITAGQDLSDKSEDDLSDISVYDISGLSVDDIVNISVKQIPGTYYISVDHLSGTYVGDLSVGDISDTSVDDLIEAMKARVAGWLASTTAHHQVVTLSSELELTDEKNTHHVLVLVLKKNISYKVPHLL